MRIEIRNDSVEIDGYVNAVGRDSRPLRDRSTGQKYLEQIVPGAFQRALSRNEVQLLLNHDQSRVLGSTEDNLELHEDTIGLRAHAIITDAEVIQKAKDHKLRGWSFGFYERGASEVDARQGMKRRFIEDMELVEVSLVDDRKIPCYDGTSIETRSEEVIKPDVLDTRADYFEAPAPEPKKEPVDYSQLKARISALEH